MLDKLIQGIEINIGEKLAVQVADGQSLSFRSVKKGFMGRDTPGKFIITMDNRIVGAVMKYQQFTEPERLGILKFFTDQGEQNLLVHTHEVIFDIKLEIQSPSAAVGSCLADEFPQASHTLVNPLAFAAGVGAVDKDRLPDGLKVIDQNMMDNPVTEISGKDFPQFRFFAKKADRTAGAVGAVRQLPAKLQQFLFRPDLKPQGVDGFPFIFSAEKILPVNIFKGEKQEKTLSAANG